MTCDDWRFGSRPQGKGKVNKGRKEHWACDNRPPGKARQGKDSIGT